MSKPATDTVFSLGGEIKIPALADPGAGDFQCKSCGVPWDEHNGVQVTCMELLTFKVLSQSLADAQVKLVAERDEARELVKRMVAATDVDAVGEDYYSAMLDAHRALRAWKDGAESWEEFSRRAKA
jgi:hypothetical protein